MRLWNTNAKYCDECCVRGNQERFAHLVPAVERIRLYLCNRLRGRQERYEYSVVAVKSLRCQQCDCLRGDHDCSAHAAPAERSM